MDLYGNARVQDGNGDGKAIVDMGAVESGAAPRPVTLANGFNRPLSVTTNDRVQLAFTVNNGKDVAAKDWWILLAATPRGSFTPDWYHYDLATGTWQYGFTYTYQGAFGSLPTVTLLDGKLPPGTYWFYFGVDQRDGLLNLTSLLFDAVQVTVH